MFEDYKNQIDTDITTKTAANSIEPVVVGNGYTDLVNLLTPYIESINNQTYYEGSGVPSDLLGEDLDLYARTQNPIVIYRKEAGTWVVKWTIPLGFTFSDGPIVGLRCSLSGSALTVTAGQWSVGGTLYTKLTQTGFTISTAHATLETQDIVYASNGDDQVLFLAGTPGLGQPTLPANSVLIEIAVIPSVASGASPYLVYGNTLGVDTSNIVSNSTETYLSASDLNTAYPSALVGQEIICESITDGPLIYKKGSAGWYSIPLGIVS